VRTDSESRLAVNHWRTQYLVPASHDAPERLRATLDDVITRDLAPALAATAAAILQDHSGQLVFVRRLALDLTLDAAWDRDAIAGVSAAALARTLCRALVDDDAGNIVRFRRVADYTAAYIVERASRSGPSPWFFSRFDGWSLLPPSNAIRSALVDDPHSGRLALSSLGESALASVVSALNAEDARWIVRVLAPPGRALDLGEIGALVRELTMPPQRVIAGDGVAVWLLARHGATTSAGAIEAAAAVVRVLAARAALHGAPPLARLLETVGDDGELFARVTVAIVRGRQNEIDRFVPLVVQRASNESAAGVSAKRTTRFGGAFMLLDDLADLDVAGDVDAWSELEGTAPVPMFRLLVLARGVAGRHWSRMLADPYWRDAFAIAPLITTRAVMQWLGEQPGGRAAAARRVATAARQIIRRFARRLPGFAASSAVYVQRNMLDVSATIDVEPDRIVVTLSRAPLDLVLTLTGRTRGERHWPWLDARPFVLFPGD